MYAIYKKLTVIFNIKNYLQIGKINFFILIDLGSNKLDFLNEFMIIKLEKENLIDKEKIDEKLQLKRFGDLSVEMIHSYTWLTDYYLRFWI